MYKRQVRTRSQRVGPTPRTFQEVQVEAASYIYLRANETKATLECRILLEKKTNVYMKHKERVDGAKNELVIKVNH